MQMFRCTCESLANIYACVKCIHCKNVWVTARNVTRDQLNSRRRSTMDFRENLFGSISQIIVTLNATEEPKNVVEATQVFYNSSFDCHILPMQLQYIIVFCIVFTVKFLTNVGYISQFHIISASFDSFSSKVMFIKAVVSGFGLVRYFP